MTTATLHTKTLNPAQLHILDMLYFCRSQQSVDDLKKILADYYAEKVQKEADRLWDEGILNGEAINNILNEHLRTPYKSNTTATLIF